MGRRKSDLPACHDPLHQRLLEDRYSVSQEYDLPVIGMKPLPQFLYANCHLILQHDQPVIIKFVDSRVDLSSSGIHDRADDMIGAAQIISQPLQGRNMNQRLIKRKPKPFGSGRAYSKPGKRSGACRHGNGIYAIQIQFRHPCHFIQHGKKRLRMRLFIIYRIFGDRLCLQPTAVYHCHACYQAGTV